MLVEKGVVENEPEVVYPVRQRGGIEIGLVQARRKKLMVQECIDQLIGAVSVDDKRHDPITLDAEGDDGGRERVKGTEHDIGLFALELENGLIEVWNEVHSDTLDCSSSRICNGPIKSWGLRLYRNRIAVFPTAEDEKETRNTRNEQTGEFHCEPDQ